MILIAVISLGAIGAVGAVFLYAASKSTKILASHKYRKSFPGRTVEVAVIRVAPDSQALA
mgnify:CR=1 FL=1